MECTDEPVYRKLAYTEYERDDEFAYYVKQIMPRKG